MPFQKWFNKRNNGFRSNRQPGTISAIINGNRQQQQQQQQPRQQTDRTDDSNKKRFAGEDISVIYLAHNSPLETVLTTLQSISENQAKVSLFFYGHSVFYVMNLTNPYLDYTEEN